MPSSNDSEVGNHFSTELSYFSPSFCGIKRGNKEWPLAKLNVVKPAEIESRLTELGVDEELLITAAKQGFAASGRLYNHPCHYIRVSQPGLKP